MRKKLNCVLLIDDDKGTNFINQMIIKKSGITDNIQTVLNGKEAIDFITNKGKFERRPNIPTTHAHATGHQHARYGRMGISGSLS